MVVDKKQGFTLIELLIALILIVTGLIVLMRMVSIGIFADSNLEYRLTALNLANEKLEQLKDDGYGNIGIGTTSETGSAIGFDFVDQREWTVGYVDANLNSTTTDTGLIDVDVEVQWTQKADTQSVSVETLIANY